MMAGWRRSTAQNPVSEQIRIYTRQQGGINTAGRIYGGTTKETADTKLVVLPTEEGKDD